MTRALPVVVLLLGVLSVIAHAALRAAPPSSGLETLPIFVPASLEVEALMRAERGQEAGRGGLEAADLARALLDERFDAATAARLQQPLSRLRAAREALLDARNRRHQLNVALMQAGVRIGRELSPPQWQHVISSRDAVKATEEAALFDALERSVQR